MPSRREVYAAEFKPTFGPSKLDESRFPTFRDGDVKIIISGGRQYQLHKSTLKNSSPRLQELLSDANTATLSNKAKKKGVVVTNILRASVNPCADEWNVATILEPVELDEEGRPISKQKVGLDLENGMTVPPVYIVSAETL